MPSSPPSPSLAILPSSVLLACFALVSGAWLLGAAWLSGLPLQAPVEPMSTARPPDGYVFLTPSSPTATGEALPPTMLVCLDPTGLLTPSPATDSPNRD